MASTATQSTDSLDNKEAATAIDSATNDAKDGNERLYFFKLSDNGIGVLEESLVLLKNEKLCFFLFVWALDLGF